MTGLFKRHSYKARHRCGRGVSTFDAAASTPSFAAATAPLPELTIGDPAMLRRQLVTARLPFASAWGTPVHADDWLGAIA